MPNAKIETSASITPTTDFWLVTKPSEQSVLEDILFTTDLMGLTRQFLGGLEANEIVGIWLDDEAARQAAQRLLDGR